MSIEGVLDNKKHGGAHVLTHEIVTNHDTQDLYVLISDNSFQKQSTAGTDCVKFQDGCHKENDTDENVFIPDNLQFLPDDLDKYEQAVVENNTEWLKARCRAIDTADFDMVTQDSTNMELLGIMDDSVIAPSSDALSELPLSLAPSNEVLISGNQNSLVQKANLNITPSHSCISSVSSVGQIPVSVETDLSSYSNADMHLDGILLSGDKDKDLELESLNPVSINNELKESPTGDAQDGFSDNLLLSDLNYGRSNVRVIMKDGVLSVVPNETEFATNSIVEQDTIDHTLPKLSNSFIQEDPVNNGSSVIAVQSMIQSQDTAAMTTQDSSMSNSQLNLPSINRTENLALATISISNDKLANSTKILVDTNQGRQLYQLNMSDLTGLMNNPVNGTEQENNISAAIVSPVKPDQLAGAQSVSGVWN